MNDRMLFEPPCLRNRADTPVKYGPDFRAMVFDAANPAVYIEFDKADTRLIETGVRHYGAKAIFEYLRFGTAVRGRGDIFKLNNNYTAYYARKWEENHPEYAGFFSMRRTNGMGKIHHEEHEEK